MIRYAIWDQTAQISDAFLRRYIQDMFCELILDFGAMDIHHDPDSLLDQTGDHLVIFSSGHVTMDPNLKASIENFCQRDFFVAGQPPLMLVNLTKYRAHPIPFSAMVPDQTFPNTSLYLQPGVRFSDCLQRLAQDALTSIPTDLTDDQIIYLNRLLRPGVFAVPFLFNTETIIEPIPAVLPQRLFGLASGFKTFVLWQRFGEPEVIYYDHNRRSLTIWQDILAHWSGENFAGFCQTRGYPYEAAKMARVLDAVADLPTVWQRFQKQPRFIHCDIIRNPQPLLAAMADAGNYIWYSNVFHYFESIRCYGVAGSLAREKDFREMIGQRWPDTGFAGATFSAVV